MKLVEKMLITLLLLFVCNIPTACAENSSKQIPVPDVEEAESDVIQEQVPVTKVVSVHSKAMGRAIMNTVVVPDQYYDPDFQEDQFPVVYLLHGYDGDYKNWPDKAPLEDLATEYSVIIVCPDGQDSWYFDSPINPKMQFETYVSSELVSYIDDNYRTYAYADFRAITGLSMGGHGALWLAWRHPDVFGSCGSMSGGVDIVPFPGKWKIANALGDYAGNKAVWESHSVMSLVPTLKPGQNIIIDDGDKDFFLEVNNKLHAALMEKGIPHDYTIRPGAHSWTYWVNSLDYHMLFFSKCFDKAYQKRLDNKK